MHFFFNWFDCLLLTTLYVLISDIIFILKTTTKVQYSEMLSNLHKYYIKDYICYGQTSCPQF